MLGTSWSNVAGQLLTHYGPDKGSLQGEAIVSASVKTVKTFVSLPLPLHETATPSIDLYAHSDTYDEGLLNCPVKPWKHVFIRF